MSMDSSVVFFSSWMILALLLALGTTAPQAHARAFFVFGDSLVDSGNNDYLVTTARADSPPYGIDYPTHRPTGRFSNGLNIPDIISYGFHLYCIFVLSAISFLVLNGKFVPCLTRILGHTDGMKLISSLY